MSRNRRKHKKSIKNKAYVRSYSLLFLLLFCFFACSEQKKNTTSLSDERIKQIKKNKSLKRTRKKKEAPQRLFFQRERLSNPQTGEIPLNVRKKELLFSKKIPKATERGAFLAENENILVNAQTTNWEIEGPVNVGGRTRALAIDVSNNENIIAGGVTGGLYRSVNGGKNWTQSETAQNFMSVSTIAQDTRKGYRNVWYYGTGEFLYVKPLPTFGASALVGDGVYKSLDSGKTWDLLESTSVMQPERTTHPFQAVKTIVVNPLNGDVLAATQGGIFLSKDGGNTWEATLGETGSVGYYDISVSSRGEYYATYGAIEKFSGIFYSTDGKNWESLLETYPSKTPCRISTGCYADVETLLVLERFSFYVSAIAISPSNPDIVYFLLDLTYPYGSNKYTPPLFRYDKGKNQWEYSLLPDNNVSEKFRIFDSQMGYNLCLAVHPEDENTVYAGGIDLFRSTDWFQQEDNTSLIGGYSLNVSDYSSYENHHPDIHRITFRHNKNGELRLLTGSDGGVHETKEIPKNETISWESLNNNYYTTQFYEVDIDKSDVKNKRILGGMQDNGSYISNPETKEWQEISGGDGGTPQYTSRGVDKFFTSSQFGYISKFEVISDKYETSDCFEESASRSSDYDFIAPLKAHPNNPDILFSAKKKTLLLNDKTTTVFNCQGNWKTFFTIPISDYSGANITALEIPLNMPNIIFVGTSRGYIYKIEGVESGNATVLSKFTPNPNGGYISDIITNPENSNELLVTYSNYETLSVFYSKNEGGTWEDISFNLEEKVNGSGSGPAVFCGEIIPLAGGVNVFFVGTSTGIYSLLSTTETWHHESSTVVRYSPVTRLLYRPEDKWFVASTFGSGVFSGDVSLLEKVNQYLGEGKYLFGLANKTNYFQGYSKELSLAFILGETEDITIEIINIRGQLITSIERKDLPPGNYYSSPLTLSTENIIPGIYFASLKVNNARVSTKKILIL